MKKKEQTPQNCADSTDLSHGLDFEGGEWDIVLLHSII